MQEQRKPAVTDRLSLQGGEAEVGGETLLGHHVDSRLSTSQPFA